MSMKTILNVGTIISKIGIMMNYKVIILSIIPTQNPILYTSFIVNINFANPSKFHATYLPYLVPWVDMDNIKGASQAVIQRFLLCLRQSSNDQKILMGFR
jgi:hypothetical protein